MGKEKASFLSRRTVSFRYSLVNLITKYVTPKRYEDFQYDRFDYLCQFTVPQLIFLCQCIEKVRDVEGSIAEVGANEGRTTVFINKYMDAQKIEKKYYAIDTFSGFTKEDIEYEVSNRSKNAAFYNDLFKTSKEAFDTVMSRNGIFRVTSIQADVNKYDLTSLGKLSFALLDVDLYRPIKKSLKELYEVLSPNGMIIVDDCDNETAEWDGAYQAYVEFMQEIGKPVEIVLEKLGVVRKTVDFAKFS